MHHTDDLRDDASHRRSDDVGQLDRGRVHHCDDVVGHAREVVGAGRRIRVAGSTIVERDTAVVTTERTPLERPPATVDAEALDQQDRRTIAATPHAERDVGAIVGNRRRHDPRLPAGYPASSSTLTERRIASVKRAAAIGSFGSYGSGNVTIDPKVTGHDPAMPPEPPTPRTAP